MGWRSTTAAVERFSAYLGLLQRWGKKINLTTRLETTEVIVYHFLDSLAGVPILSASPTARVVDLGAGAGLPSLPLKFALPGLRVLLVESVRKKVAFCQEVIRATGVTGIEAVWGRGEDLGARPITAGPTTGPSAGRWGLPPTWQGLRSRFSRPAVGSSSTRGSPIPKNFRRSTIFCTEKGGAWELRKVSIPI